MKCQQAHRQHYRKNPRYRGYATYYEPEWGYEPSIFCSYPHDLWEKLLKKRKKEPEAAEEKQPTSKDEEETDENSVYQGVKRPGQKAKKGSSSDGSSSDHDDNDNDDNNHGGMKMPVIPDFFVR